MGARHVLAIAAAAFLGAAIVRIARGRGAAHPQTRTWLLVGVIFALVSAWLWMQEA